MAGWGLLEFTRTQEIVCRYLPPPPAVIVDVGGGAGPYSEWLGGLGYETHLVDLVPSHVDAARRNAHIASAQTGDARRLPFDNAFADAALLFGPLYHLTEERDRIACLQDARRVLRPGGLIFAAGICRFAPLLASLVTGIFDDPAFLPVLVRDLESGQHRNTTGDPRRFTTAFFHRPEDQTRELLAAGFRLIEQVPVEGSAWLACGRKRDLPSAGRMRSGVRF